jgi:hypothetical protein
MRVNLVLTGATETIRNELQRLLNEHPLPDAKHELHITTAEKFDGPQGRKVVNIEDGEIQFHYFFSARVDNEKQQLDEFVHAHTVYVQEQIIANQQFQSNTLLTGMWHTLTDGFKNHIVPSAGVVADGAKSHWNGTNTLFTKSQYNRLAKAEFVLGATAGVASIVLGFLTPTIAAIIAISALLLIAAAIYHKTLAKGMEPEPEAPAFH